MGTVERIPAISSFTAGISTQEHCGQRIRTQASICLHLLQLRMNVTPSDISHSELYGILLNSVAPRPIAWVSTLNPGGQPNLAPFSFFNVVCVDPPLLAFAPGLRASKRTELAAR